MRHLSQPHRDLGFTVVEVLVALIVVLVVSTGVVELFVASLGATRDAKAETAAVLLATQKLEQLRAVSPTSVEIAPSAEDALDLSTTGYSDIVDSRGRPVTGAATPSSTVFLRRWSIRSVAMGSGTGLAIRVLVTTSRADAGGRVRGALRRRRQAEALVVGLTIRR